MACFDEILMDCLKAERLPMKPFLVRNSATLLKMVESQFSISHSHRKPLLQNLFASDLRWLLTVSSLIPTVPAPVHLAIRHHDGTLLPHLPGTPGQAAHARRRRRGQRRGCRGGSRAPPSDSRGQWGRRRRRRQRDQWRRRKGDVDSLLAPRIHSATLVVASLQVGSLLKRVALSQGGSRWWGQWGRGPTNILGSIL